jgi:hypothetical protein
MHEFTKQFFDLLLNLDSNWKVETVIGNYRLKEVEIKIRYISNTAEYAKQLIRTVSNCSFLLFPIKLN